MLRTRRQHTATLGTAHNYIINEAMTYDHAGRLLTTHHQIGDSGDNILISSNTYNEKDELSKKKLANSQDVDYDYNIRGWLNKINDPASCTSADLFSMGLHYDEENINLSTSILKNGNISWIEWRTGAECKVGGVTRNKGGYGFSYDGTNRLTLANYGEYDSNNAWVSANADRYTVDNLSYDENGNIKTLRRMGNTSGSNYGLIDDLAYTYNSSIPNRLNTIAETSLITKGFKKVSAGATAYTYDLNGNVNKDGYRGITSTTNNYLNLPAKITYSATKYIEYTYDASGTKWKQKTVDGAAITEKYYIGGIEYMTDRSRWRREN